MNGDMPRPATDDRAAYLRKLAATVWPGPPAAQLVRGGRPGLLVLPSAARPRLLVPYAPSRVAAAAARQATEAVGTASRLRRGALAAVLRIGLAGYAFRDRLVVTTAGSLAAHLSRLLPETGLHAETRLHAETGQVAELLGEGRHPADLLLAVHLGPARANRKPVLQLLDHTGQPVAFAKLGVDQLTRSLVDAEADALRRLAGAELPGVEIPEVWHHGDWRGHRLLVQRALPVQHRRAAPRAARAAEQAAMVTVSRCLGVRNRSWAGSPYASRLADALADLDGRPEAGRLRVVLAVIDRTDPVLRFGAAHGDWNSGNRAVLADGRVLLWDWERFAPDVPVGFDALHRRLQTAITRDRVAAERAAEQLISAAAGLLDPYGQPTTAAESVAVLYLLDLALRYLRDRQAEAGARLGHVDRWLLPAVERWVATRYGQRGRVG